MGVVDFLRLLSGRIVFKNMKTLNNDQIHSEVRKTYGDIATGQSGSCCGGGSSCAPGETTEVDELSKILGYSDKELKDVPEGANLGLGCGNPQAIAAIQSGETVLDLGSGAGFDAFLAAKQVGETGQVIGVDMTHEMLLKARKNAESGGYTNVEFRLGEIESLPVADNSVDVIISNCVINLSPDKTRVFQEAWRVLKPGGRLAISDVVARGELPEKAREDIALYTGCMSGASSVSDLKTYLKDAGFKEISIKPKDGSAEFIADWAPGTGMEDFVLSANIEGRK